MSEFFPWLTHSAYAPFPCCPFRRWSRSSRSPLVCLPEMLPASPERKKMTGEMNWRPRPLSSGRSSGRSLTPCISTSSIPLLTERGNTGVADSRMSFRFDFGRNNFGFLWLFRYFGRNTYFGRISLFSSETGSFSLWPIFIVFRPKLTV